MKYKTVPAESHQHFTLHFLIQKKSNELRWLSLERVLRLLEGFGFSRVDAEVYMYLAKTGPQKGKDLNNGLKMPKQQLYPALESLQKKGVVTRSSERPILFSALTFEELLNLYVKLNVDQAQIIKETKGELLASWRDMTKKNNS